MPRSALASPLPTTHTRSPSARHPSRRIVYVDNDPVVLAHARALLTSTSEGSTAYLDADIRDPAKILAQAAETLDFSQPIAVLLIAVLHGTSDVGSDDMPEAERRYNAQASAQFHARDREHVSRFFDGLDLVGPGLLNLSHWWQGTSADGGTDTEVAACCGLARKP